MTYTHTVTNLPEENEYPKLVRDKIPEVIFQADGRKVPIQILELDEFISHLKHKAIEEAVELDAATSDDHLLEEIADLREILDALQEAKGFSSEQVLVVQNQKRQKRGGFSKRILMLDNK